MEKVNLKVEGMDCTNCALTIHRFLESKGLQNVKVNFIGGDVSFDRNEKFTLQEAEKGITGLGYHIKQENDATEKKKLTRIGFTNHFQRFIFCFIFTAPLLIDMLPGVHIHALMDPYMQLGLTLPVFITGMSFFGTSAIRSLLKGIPT